MEGHACHPENAILIGLELAICALTAIHGALHHMGTEGNTVAQAFGTYNHHSLFEDHCGV